MAKTLVKPTSKGQVTIPKRIREKLNISQETFLDVRIQGERIIFEPVSVKSTNKSGLRVYTDQQIAEFLEEDKLSKEDAEFVNRLLGTNKY